MNNLKKNAHSNRMARNTVIYFVGSVLGKIISFFLIPLYTTYIPPNKYGVFEANTSLVILLTTALFLDIGACIMRFSYEAESEEDKEETLYSGLLLFAFSFLIFCVISLIAGLTLCVEYAGYLFGYGTIYILLNSFYNFLVRLKGSSTLFALGGIINTLIYSLLNLFFLTICDMDYSSLYLSTIIAGIIVVLLYESKIHVMSSFRVSFIKKTKVLEMLWYALPLSVNSIAFWLLSSSKTQAVNILIGPEYTGYLGIANKFTQFVYLASTSFQLAWQENSFSRNDQERNVAGQYYTKATRIFSRYLVVFVLLIITAIRIGLFIFPSFIDAQYNEAIKLIPLAILGSGLAAFSSFLGSIFGAIKKTKTIFTTTAAGALVNIVSLVIFIKTFGIIGANIAFALGFTTVVVTRLLLLRREIGLQFNYLYFPFTLIIYLCTRLAFTYGLGLNLILLVVFLCLGLFMYVKIPSKTE